MHLIVICERIIEREDGKSADPTVCNAVLLKHPEGQAAHFQKRLRTAARLDAFYILGAGRVRIFLVIPVHFRSHFFFKPGLRPERARGR